MNVPESPIRVAVLFGGPSGEHEVSCSSAVSIVQNLDRRRFEVLPVRVSREGLWGTADKDPGPDVDVAALIEATPLPGLHGAAGAAEARSDRSGSVGPRGESLGTALAALAQVDVAFPAFHGRFGEDGTVQSFLELLDVPYVGNGIAASAVSMDKQWTKTMLVAAGLEVADGVVVDATSRPGDELSPDERARLGLPVFVKPAREGSSIGVGRVDDWADLPAALAQARRHDAKVLVEAAVIGREVDVAVLEHPDGRLECGPPLEIRVDGAGFFDFESKYGGDADFRIPADLPAETTARLHQQAMRAFEVLGCSGLLRVDFFLRTGSTGALEPVVNEVNTFPGFTALSQYPRIWQAAGLSYPDLLGVLIDTALSPAGAGATARAGRSARSTRLGPARSDAA
jgi:D-alanine-D-alanine ligase